MPCSQCSDFSDCMPSASARLHYAGRRPTGGQAAARSRHCLLRRPGGAAVDGFPSGGDHPFQPLSDPTLTPHLPTPVSLCFLDGVSGRISTPHPGTPPTLLLSGGASTGGCSPPGEPLWQTAGGAAHPVGTCPEGRTVSPDVAGEPCCSISPPPCLHSYSYPASRREAQATMLGHGPLHPI
jgi:hypothetical protein